MHCGAYTHFVNQSPEGKELPLTPRQLFDGLKIKARDPGEFVPAIEHCEVVSESKTGLLREVKFKDKPEHVRERVEFFEPMTVDFTMLSLAEETLGRITNVISTTPDGEVLLTFTFALVENKHDAAADELSKKIAAGGGEAVSQTIKVVRKMVKEGKV